jgi:hypothetical protein
LNGVGDVTGTGHIDIKFDGELTWGEFKKAIELAGRGIPRTAMVSLGNNGSSNKSLIEQVVSVEWELSEMDHEIGQVHPRSQREELKSGQIRSGA